MQIDTLEDWRRKAQCLLNMRVVQVHLPENQACGLHLLLVATLLHGLACSACHLWADGQI